MKINDLNIRQLKITDSEAYLIFAKNIIMEGKFSLTHIDEFTHTVNDEREWIKSVIENKNNVCLVACTYDKIVGSINILQYKQRKLLHIADLNINISKEYRDRGLGRKLIETALSIIKKTPNIKKVTLQVLEDNYRAIHLYSIYGFSEEGRFIDHIGKENKEYVDLVVMSLFL